MTGELTQVAPSRVPAVPWRDPHTVSPVELREYIRSLETACEQNPRSADLRTCLGMAYAMNYEVYKSMDALELATAIGAGTLLRPVEVRRTALPAPRTGSRGAGIA